MNIEKEKIEKVTMQANDLIKHFAPNYKLKFNKRFKRILGQTDLREKTITLQYGYVLYADFGTILETILHEIIHTFPGCGNHGPIWQAHARNFGITPARGKRITLLNEVNLFD